MSDGELTVKIDVLDLLIEVLREHEKALDNITYELQIIADELYHIRRQTKI